MNDRTTSALIGIAFLALLFYVFIGPLHRDDLDRARTTVHEEIRAEKTRLDNSFEAAKQDLRDFPPQPEPAPR